MEHRRGIYCCAGGGVVLPLGEAEGEQGVPFGLVPAVLAVPGSLPAFGVEGDEPGLDVAGSFDPGVDAPGLDDPEFGDPGFGELGIDEPGFDDPAFGVEPFGVPGVTQGVPSGFVPGLLGDVVDGCAVPGVGGAPDPD